MPKRTQHLKYTYNLSEEDYAILLKEQDYKCAICKKEEDYNGRTNLSVDHNHLSNKNRGLLCGRCNTLIGFANENKELLLKMVEYLVKYKNIGSGLML